MSPSRPQPVRVGDSWQFIWQEYGVGLRVEHPKESAYGMSAELTAERVRNGSSGHIHWSRLKISDTTDREKVATLLMKRTGSGQGTERPYELDNAVPWALLLEQACTIVAREHRAGEETKLLRDIDVPDQRAWLLPRFLPADETTLAYADGGSGKSLWGLLLGLAVQSGRVLPGGLAPTRQANVLYLDWETHERTLRRRQRGLCRGLGWPEPDLHYLRMSTALALHQAHLAAEIARLQIGLVIVDSVGFAAHGDINDAVTATEFYNALRSFGVTALAIHHLNKAAAERTDGPVKPFGAAYWWNGARNAWELRSVQEDAALAMSLWQRKDNDGGVLGRPLGYHFAFEEDGERITVTPHDVGRDPELSQYGGQLYVLLQTLQGGGRTTKELAEETGFDAKAIRTLLGRSPRVVRLEAGGGRGQETRWGLASHDR